MLLVLLHRGENKHMAEEIHRYPSLQHTTFLNRARDDFKRHTVTKAFIALKGRTDIECVKGDVIKFLTLVVVLHEPLHDISIHTVECLLEVDEY